MTDRREDRYQRVVNSITRWQAKLQRAARMIDKLEKQRKRLEKAMAAPPRPRGSAALADLSGTIGPAIRESIQDQLREATVSVPAPAADDGIPAFLRRTSDDADAAASDTIKAEQADLKRRKAQGRIATMKAKKSGATRAMPLSGKAALDAIRNG